MSVEPAVTPAGDTAEVMFWQSEYAPAGTYAGSVCGW